VCALLSLAGGSACADDHALHCDDLLPVEQATYSAVVELVVKPSAKSCGTCHHTDTPIGGYNFEGRAVAYDSLSTKMEIIYTQVASGEMPEMGERWDEADLRLLRSWYCHGAFYEE
jgi:hypothetical protein